MVLFRSIQIDIHFLKGIPHDILVHKKDSFAVTFSFEVGLIETSLINKWMMINFVGIVIFAWMAGMVTCAHSKGDRSRENPP